MSTHQLDQAVFRPVLPEDVDWQPFPAFPPSARLAVVVGDPSQPAPYVVRVQAAVRRQADAPQTPRGSGLHSHVRRVLHRRERTVRRRKAAGVPAGRRHRPAQRHPSFPLGKSGEYVTQVTAFGPISLEYLDPEDDPRNK